MYTIDTSVVIGCPPHAVWGVIADFAAYQEWNPFILHAAGEAVAGQTLMLYIRPPGERGMTHRPTVTIAEPGRHLQWLGSHAVPGLFTARHEFLLEPVDEKGTLVRHRERFSGLLVPLLRRTLHRTEEGFSALNCALKQRVEANTG